MLTAEGFKRKRYEDFLPEMQNDARELFGADVNLSDSSNLGKLIKLWAYARAEENELSEAVYLSAYIDHAEDAQLDAVVKYKGVYRNQAQKAIGTARFTVDSGASVAVGTIIATAGEVEFVTTATVTDSDLNGLVDAPIEAILAGVSGNVPSNTITTINTPAVGIQSVTNVVATTGGLEQETNSELRNRYKLTTGGSSTLDGIRAKVLNEVSGVRAAVVIGNSEPTTVNGRPPHSFETVVSGGVAEDIAAAILKVKPAGIRAYGSESVVVNDDSGTPQTIGFSFATKVDAYVKIDITTNSSYPTNGDSLIKSEVVKYIGGTDSNGTVYLGLGMGDDVIQAKIVNAVFSVPGIVDATVTLSTDNVTFTAANVAISQTQVAETSHDKVVIL